MQKYVKYFAIFLVVSIIIFYMRHTFTTPKTYSSQFSVSGAFSNGTYSGVSQKLCDYLNSTFANTYLFTAQESSGSVENIIRLQEGETDIALIQEDVAYYYYRGGHTLLKVEHTAENYIKSVCFFFNEYFVVLARPHKKNLHDLRKVNVGSLHGGTGITAINVRDQLQYHWELNTDSPIDAMRENKVDAVIVTTANAAFLTKQLREENIEYHPIGLSNKEMSGIAASFPFYHKAHITIESYQGKKVTIPTITTRSLLVVNDTVAPEIVSAILEIFIDKKTYDNFGKKFSAVTNFDKTQMDNERERFGNFPLPIHPVVFELQRGRFSFIRPAFFVLPLAFICCFLIYLRSKERYKIFCGQRMFYGVLYRELFRDLWIYIFLISLVLIYLIAAVYFIKYLEIQAYIQSEFMQPSKFIDMKFRKLITWIFVFTVAGYEDETFPYTELGKVIASSIRIVSISCMMFIFGRLSIDYLKNLVKDRHMYKGYSMSNHIVICNWNSKGEKIVEEIHSPSLKAQGIAKPIIIICNHEITLPDSDAFQDTFFLPGDPGAEWKLRNASLHNAFSTIILADETMGDRADSHTVMVVMEMTDLFDRLEEEGKLEQRPHISAELIDGKNIKYLKRAGVNEVISGNDLGVRLLAQSTVTPGITEFMDNILQYCNQTNEIYIIDAPKLLVERKANFITISQFLLENRKSYHNTLLLAIQRNKKMMVNPSSEEFIHLLPGDRLVVLAKERPVIV
ncbi:TAXI family TRAP transporter solute-binding subunit [Candidatus Uabimicrobium sp. HlEnr_7]|uniref:TAXI family TRAP transporter solute-binding subunit n=1 Tax=Candidatus Uabimicrobium helgolandensis TaxID=3095367 RepID=UPI003556B4DD